MDVFSRTLKNYEENVFPVLNLQLKNKTGTSKIGAVLKAQKAQSFENMLRTFSDEKITKRVETAKGCLS